MNINLVQAKSLEQTKGKLKKGKDPSGAKAFVDFDQFTARLKSCPDSRPKRLRRFWGDAGATLIFIQCNKANEKLA
jgi:hypothetical protein